MTEVNIGPLALDDTTESFTYQSNNKCAITRISDCILFIVMDTNIQMTHKRDVSCQKHNYEFYAMSCESLEVIQNSLHLCTLQVIKGHCVG